MPEVSGLPDQVALRRPWRFVICENDWTELGEPWAFDRKLSFGLSKSGTASFRIRDDDPLWEFSASGEARLKCFDSEETLRFLGPIVADSEAATGQGASIQLTAQDMFWYLTKRYIAKDTTGVGVTLAPPGSDPGHIIDYYLGQLNTEYDTGIDMGNRDDFVDRGITLLFKRMSDLVMEMGGIEGSYEWVLRYDDSGLTPACYIDLYQIAGQDRTASLFLEYGTGKNNCSRYEKVRSIDTSASDVYVAGDGNSKLAYAYDSAARDRFGARLEDVVSYGDITIQSLLDGLAAAHVAVRRYPRQIVSLTPFAMDTPRMGVDYEIGDRVTARVVVNGRRRVDGAVRIWGVDIDIDELGNERASFRLVPE